MNLKIVECEECGYTILLEGEFFRYCRTYAELEKTMGNLIKSKYVQDATGFM